MTLDIDTGGEAAPINLKPIVMKNSSVNKSSSGLKRHQFDEPLEIGILADSLEVMEAHIQDRINQLEKSLNQLNLLDNPTEIVSICREIIEQRLLLAKVSLKKRRASYGC